MTISSLDSYRDFVRSAWQYLARPETDRVPLRNVLKVLYNAAAGYNPNGVADKKRLIARDLYAALAAYCRAIQGKRARLQLSGPWRDVTDDLGAYADYYEAVLGSGQPKPNPEAMDLATRYLHVYPAEPAKNDWRLGLNVEPRSMASAAKALVPLLDKFPDIGHMKFFGPGAAGKANSVIVYLRKTERYNRLRNAVLDAVKGLAIQPRVGAMWNEIGDGIGEASEPPRASFTQYRCLAIYAAFLAYSETAGPHSWSDFKAALNTVLPAFGIDPRAPHMRAPRRTQDPNYPAYWDVFCWLYAILRG